MIQSIYVLRAKHNINKLLKCFACKYKVISIAHLKNHMVKHTREKNFVCDKENCNKKFGKKSDWKRHFNIHTGERKFDCKECKKQFGAKSSLKKHEKTFHAKDKKLFQCDYGKRFSRKSDLDQHMRTHKKSKCPKCPEEFVDLEFHLAKNHPQEIFKCSKCDEKSPTKPRRFRNKRYKCHFD